NFEIDVDGSLKTTSGLNVLDTDGEPIVLPAMLEDININKDGVISGRPQGADANVIEEFARIKCVSVDDYREIEKGYDGLFRRIDGQTIEEDMTIQLRSGMLESSNVNPVEELTNLIRIQRQFDTQVKMMDTADQMDERQNVLLSYD
ncbi:MAG: flagellar basal body rod C-terminal domain-containing protein, partial [Succinivibrio sp.]